MNSSETRINDQTIRRSYLWQWMSQLPWAPRTLRDNRHCDSWLPNKPRSPRGQPRPGSGPELQSLDFFFQCFDIKRKIPVSWGAIREGRRCLSWRPPIRGRSTGRELEMTVCNLGWLNYIVIDMYTEIEWIWIYLGVREVHSSVTVPNILKRFMLDDLQIFKMKIQWRYITSMIVARYFWNKLSKQAHLKRKIPEMKIFSHSPMMENMMA